MNVKISLAAGRELDAEAQEIRSVRKCSYDEAFKLAREENPVLAHQYDTGQTDMMRHDYAELSQTEKEMILLVNDAAKVQRLASGLLDHYARLAIGQGRGPGPISQFDPGIYKQALADLKRRYPTLSRASEDGYIDPGDWALLAFLIPGTSSAIRNEKGINPLKIDIYYSSRGGSRVYHDRNNNEYRRYDL